jgi:hypothetical protein
MVNVTYYGAIYRELLKLSCDVVNFMVYERVMNQCIIDLTCIGCVLFSIHSVELLH